MSTLNPKNLPSRGKQSAASKKGMLQQTAPTRTLATARGKQFAHPKQDAIPQRSAPIAPPAPIEETIITVDGKNVPIIEIRATGDVIIDVTFENTLLCDKSIEGGRIMEKMKEDCRSNKTKPEPTRKLYRVRVETLKKNSKYFDQLLGSDVFGEGIKVKAALEGLRAKEDEPSQAAADQLPRVTIQDDEDSTRTFGREKVFEDMLRIVHGGSHCTDPKFLSLHYMAVLVTMADRFECMEPVSRYLQTGPLARFKYPASTTEESIRKKLLIFSLAKITPLQANATFESCAKELIVKGSVRWGQFDETEASTAQWWSLPGGLEDELAYRRKCVLSCLASLQSHFLAVYTSKEQQCRLGYDSSVACDSFQLGEMIKFLTSKKLLSLSTFSSLSPDDEDYVWPEAYTGNIEELMTILHRVPTYQIDKFHNHCGLRNRILPPLDYIRNCLASGVAVPGARWFKDRDSVSWLLSSQNSKKPTFTVAGKDIGNNHLAWSFGAVVKNGTGNLGGPGSSERMAKHLFTANSWDWQSDREIPVLGRFFADGSLNLRTHPI